MGCVANLKLDARGHLPPDGPAGLSESYSRGRRAVKESFGYSSAVRGFLQDESLSFLESSLSHGTCRVDPPIR